MAPIVVQSADARLPMTLFDLGAGGFSVESGTPLRVGQVMSFRFSTPDGGWAAVLSAESVYSKPNPPEPSKAPRFLTGFQFVHTTAPGVTASINALIDRATSVISFS